VTKVGAQVGPLVGARVGYELGVPAVVLQPIDHLLAAPGAFGLWDVSNAASRTLRADAGTDYVAALADLLAGRSMAAPDANQPAFDVEDAVFDGTADYLTLVSAAFSVFGAGASFSLMVVSQRVAAAAATRALASLSNTANNTDYTYLGVTSTGLDFATRANSVGSASDNGLAVDTSYRVRTLVVTGTTARSWIDGALSCEAALTHTHAVNAFSVGARVRAAAPVAFNACRARGWLLASQAWTDEERALLEGYAADHWI